MCFEAHPLILIGNGSYIRFRRLPLGWKVRIEIFGSRVWHLYKKNRKSVSHWLLYQLIPPIAPHESFLSKHAWYDISPAARPSRDKAQPVFHGAISVWLLHFCSTLFFLDFRIQYLEDVIKFLIESLLSFHLSLNFKFIRRIQLANAIESSLVNIHS